MDRSSERWREDWALSPMEEGERAAAVDFATEIMDIMEQGILLWSPAGLCELHNARIYEVLGLEPGDLIVGTRREAFEATLVERGMVTQEDLDKASEAAAQALPCSFDVSTARGAVVVASSRPNGNGGCLMTFTDVTEARRVAADLSHARDQAQEAELRAQDFLQTEYARQHDARMLSQLDEWLQSCKTLDELYMIVTKFMGRAMSGTVGELYTYSNSRDVLDGVGSWSTDTLQSHIPPDSCWALRRGRAYEYHAKDICFVCNHLDHPPDEEYDCEYVCVPIVAHGDTVGLMHVRYDDAVHSGEGLKNAMKFTRQCAEHISMAIANVKLRDELHDQSIRDPLTGLYNRRYFMDAMRREISMSDRKKMPFGLLSFDADKFKSFNDNHGHDAGDAVLRALSEISETVIGSKGICCRVGGEEFAILLRGMNGSECRDMAEQLRAAVELMQVRYVDGVLPRVTISIGVSTYPRDGSDPQTLLKSADKALYVAKDTGRNRVCGGEEDDAAQIGDPAQAEEAPNTSAESSIPADAVPSRAPEQPAPMPGPDAPAPPPDTFGAEPQTPLHRAPGAQPQPPGSNPHMPPPASGPAPGPPPQGGPCQPPTAPSSGPPPHGAPTPLPLGQSGPAPPHGGPGQSPMGQSPVPPGPPGPPGPPQR